jgi:hypothetical protein
MLLTTDKPKPIVEKLEFGQEDQNYINSMLEGKPSSKIVNYWQRTGKDVKKDVQK